ncbi:protein AF-10 isoform X2 [Pelobates fuscus]|uniref:protein AF-10 isoform X2 n=1 Tax=Pelobates fuscus TaxID=191477 RepID=UPI002FE475C8
MCQMSPMLLYEKHWVGQKSLELMSSLDEKLQRRDCPGTGLQMVSGDSAAAEQEEEGLPTSMKEMIGGCCVCSDERGWAENPLVYCDGHGCNVAVHQACYGIVQVPTGPWFCRKCESQERAARVRCELCPHKDGALKRTDNGGWAHVVCALYIPEVQFANVSTMEPIVLQSVPHERYNKTCYICDEQGRESKAATGACMTCNKHGCRQAFHVTCAQFAGLLCEEEGNGADNVQYCGYCKYHYSKLHKEKEKHKQKSRKQMEPLPSVPPLTVTTEKTYTCSNNNNSSGTSVTSTVKRLEETAARFTNANFQEVSSHPLTGKETLEARNLESKGKKSTSHNSIQRGRKSGSGRNNAATTAATSPFQQGNFSGTPNSVKSSSGSSVQSPQEFLGFSESEVRTDGYHHPQQPLSTKDIPKGESGLQEGTINCFSSLIGLPSNPAMSFQTKNYDNVPGEYINSSLTGYKRVQSSLMDEDAVKEKKRKGNKQNKHGPGRPKGNKGQEAGSHLSVSSASPTSSVASAAGSITGSGLQRSPTLLRNGSLQSLSVGSSPVGSGIYNSNDVAATFSNVISGSSTPVSSSHITQCTSTHLQQGGASSPSPSSSTSVLANTSTTQVNALPGSTVSVTSSQIYNNRPNPTSTTGLLAGLPESVLSADQDIGDNSRSLAVKGASPRGSVSPRSPLSSLPARYEQSGNSSLENIPPVATSIEQLLERQWNEGQQFLQEQGATSDLLGMLKSLHQLQVENRRLEEQIKNLTAKKERLQLLNAQLSVPFPTIAAIPNTASHTHTYPLHNADSLTISKSPHLGNFQAESTLPVSHQDHTSSGQSTSSSSSLSTPPPDRQSPAQQVQGVQRVNRVTVGTLTSGIQTVTQALPAVPSVGAIIGALPANQLAINGIVGALNGVIQTPATLPQTTALSHGSILPNVTHPITSTLTNSASGLGLLSDQQRQLLLHHQHQQFQQLLGSQQLTPEQHNAILYQLMQQHHQQQQSELQQLQIPAAAQLPLNSLLTASQAAPLHTTTTNPFLAMHSDSAAQKVSRLGDKTGPVMHDKS